MSKRRARINTGVQNIVTGVPLVDRVLAEMPISLQKKGARKATRAAAKIVLAEARKLAPKRTGALRRSLVVRAAKRSRAKAKRHNVAHRVTMRTRVEKRGQYYPAFMEFGTKKRTSWTGNRGAINAERFTYMRKALYGKRAEIRATFIDELSRWLAQESSKGKVVHGVGGGDMSYHGDWLEMD